MEMGQPARNGGGKVVTFDDAVAGRRRNGSLSSYLDAGRDVEAAAAAGRPPLAPGMGSRRRRTYADDELDVFTAERYFKGALDGDAAAAAAAWPAAAVALAKPSSTRASTASSASSANSQTALFSGGHRRRGGGSKCGCVHVGVLMRTCSGKRSVRVDDGGAAAATTTNKEAHGGGGGGEPAARRIDWYRELRMHKAAIVGLPGDDGSSNNHGVVAAVGLPPSSLNLGAAKVAAIGRDEKAAAELACSSTTKRSFTLVAPVRTSVVPASHGRVGGAAGGAGGKGEEEEEEEDYDGGGSESSSDLFEIKSLMIEDCPYEPSEASIQWSVVTADASSERGGGGRGPVAGRQQHHQPVGLLAGCASHRAVDVSSAVAKAVPSPAAAAMMQRRGDGFQKARRSNGA